MHRLFYDRAFIKRYQRVNAVVEFLHLDIQTGNGMHAENGIAVDDQMGGISGSLRFGSVSV